MIARDTRWSLRDEVAAHMGRSTLRVLDALADYSSARHISPTLDELAERVGVTKSTVHLHLVTLRTLGLVEWDEGKARTLRITADGREVAV